MLCCQFQIVREHYLRDDIWCGSEICNLCNHKPNEIILGSGDDLQSTKFNFPHYLVFDTNVILNQIDVLEEDALKNVVILTTVLDEVKHKSSAVYKRLRDLISNPSKNYFIFVNEHHKYVDSNL